MLPLADFILMSWRDGESGEFDVKSEGGFERLKNLQCVVYVETVITGWGGHENAA